MQNNEGSDDVISSATKTGKPSRQSQERYPGLLVNNNIPSFAISIFVCRYLSSPSVVNQPRNPL